MAATRQREPPTKEQATSTCQGRIVVLKKSGLPSPHLSVIDATCDRAENSTSLLVQVYGKWPETYGFK